LSATCPPVEEEMCARPVTVLSRNTISSVLTHIEGPHTNSLPFTDRRAWLSTDSDRIETNSSACVTLLATVAASPPASTIAAEDTPAAPIAFTKPAAGGPPISLPIAISSGSEHSI
jgi:hypothetical protein